MSKRKYYEGRTTDRKGNFKRRRTGNYQFQQTPPFVPRTMGPFAVSESKYFESKRSSIAISEGNTWVGSELDPATMNTLVAPVVGSTVNARVGNKIALYKIAINGVVSTVPSEDQTDILNSPAVRLVLYIDQQTNGVQSQGEEVIASLTNLTTPTEAFCSFQNIANFGRFRVLKDIILRPRIVTAMVDGTNTSSQNVSDIPFKMVVKFKKPLIMKFNNNGAGTVGDIVDNSFHMIGQKSSANFDTNITYISRAYYKDQ